MNDETIREQLSSLMDGELAADSAKFLSKRLGNDAELLATWERWHGVRDALRKQETLAPVDFCARVRLALDEDAPETSAPVSRAGLWRTLAGTAIAAGVAAMALMLGQPTLAPTESFDAGAATLAHVAPVTTNDLTPNWRLSPVADRQSFVLAQPQVSNDFDQYFVEHGLANGSNGAFGVVPYVPMVVVPATSGGVVPEQPNSSR